MIGYWVGLIVGLITAAALVAFMTGNPFAATPALLAILVFAGGLDIPLFLAGGRETWRAAISRATPPQPLMIAAGFCVFIVPLLAACVIASYSSGLNGLLAAWVVLVLGAACISWGLLYLLARGSNHRLQLTGDARE